jgi:serine/threonine protein phosphatase 1
MDKRYGEPDVEQTSYIPRPPRRWVIGDIHGADFALEQVFKRSGFDEEQDLLICLGDVVDGWPGVARCMDMLLTVKNLVLLLGNHDVWFERWAATGEVDDLWLPQGGRATVRSFGLNTWLYLDLPQRYREFFRAARLWYELDGKMFVHGGWDVGKYEHPVDDHRETLTWDRELLLRSKHQNRNLTKFAEVYIGHTTTELFGGTEPLCIDGVWAMDTGAGWSGKLTILDIDTKEYFQSDKVRELYPKRRGRNRAA